MRRFILLILDILIIIAFFVLVFLIVKPQYTKYNEMVYQANIKRNVYTARAAIEFYIAEHIGKYPKSIDEIYPYIEKLGGMVNPLTKKKITPSEIKIFNYSLPQEYKKDDEVSENFMQKGIPGSIGIGLFIPIGDSVVKNYGVIGFMKDSCALYYLDPAKKKHVFLVNG
uniref:Type II secretion system protein n=1 Tax=candidate division WOR-3 bacterium TaxID=2052148 RepID=A0A7C4YQT7_UNCW3